MLPYLYMYVCVKFQLSISDSFRGSKGSQILRWGVNPLTLVPHYGVKVHAPFALTEEGSSYCVTAVIVHVKFRCKVIRHLMSNSVSEMSIFVGFG